MTSKLATALPTYQATAPDILVRAQVKSSVLFWNEAKAVGRRDPWRGSMHLMLVEASFSTAYLQWTAINSQLSLPSGINFANAMLRLECNRYPEYSNDAGPELLEQKVGDYVELALPANTFMLDEKKASRTDHGKDGRTRMTLFVDNNSRFLSSWKVWTPSTTWLPSTVVSAFDAVIALTEPTQLIETGNSIEAELVTV